MKVDDLSGDKHEDRLIYMISVNNDIKYVKITPNSEPEYDAEINIYKELNAYMNRNIITKNKILQMCHNGIITNLCSNIQMQLNKDIICKLSSEYSLNIKHLYKENNNDHKNYGIQYFVTDYNDNFCSIINNSIFFRGKYTENPEKFHILMENLFTTLIHLNHKLGFIHWDLHAENLLINKETCTDFLLYDFDMAETDLIVNNSCIDRYMEKNNGNIDIKKNINSLNIENKTYEEKKKIYGLAGDILMFYFCTEKIIDIEININYFKSDIIKIIIKKIIDMKYIDKKHMFGVLVPILSQILLKIFT